MSTGGWSDWHCESTTRRNVACNSGETPRSSEACAHLDESQALRGDAKHGSITFRIDTSLALRGTISLCNGDRRDGYTKVLGAGRPLQPVFKLWSAATKLERIVHPPNGFEMPKYRNSCMVVVSSLPRAELEADIYLNVEVSGDAGAAVEIVYIVIE